MSVQRSTEVLGNELLISHIISKLDSSSVNELSITKLSDHVEGMEIRDTLSLYSNLKEYGFRQFADVPNGVRNLTTNDGFQVIYFFRRKAKFQNRIVVTTELEFYKQGKSQTVKTTDTLLRRITYHIPQP